MADTTPIGTPKGVPLFLDVNQNRFVPLGIVEDDGAGDAGLLLTQIKQPTSNGSVSQLEPSANSVSSSSISTAAQRNGLHTVATPFPFDAGGSSLIRATGGVFGSVALTHTAHNGQDVRAALYGVDADTTTQSVPILATAAGALQVASSPIAPATLTTAADFTTVAATNSSIIAANTARRFAIVQNLDTTNSVKVGDTNISATQGITLGPGEGVTLETQAEIFVRPLAGTPIVTRTEIIT